MKVLLAYDDSAGARAALTELSVAGLPVDAEALVLTVAEQWAPPTSAFAAVEGERPLTPLEREAAALQLAQAAAARLKQDFPDWQITGVACSGGPAAQIIQTAADWRADLIVVGSHGWNALERFAFGSVSLKVSHEAPCSVRITRESNRLPNAPPVRLVIGVDGSPDARAAVSVVAQRHWPPNTEVRLVTAIGAPDWQTGLPFETVRIQARAMQQEAENQLAEAGLAVSSIMAQLYASNLLLEEAERWQADAIFVGTRGRGLVSRLLIGSVSSAVAKNAKCSVEIVRGLNGQ